MISTQDDHTKPDRHTSPIYSCESHKMKAFSFHLYDESPSSSSLHVCVCVEKIRVVIFSPCRIF